MDKKSLTPAMQEAYDLAKSNGGKLLRFAGGYWGAEWKGRYARYIGTTTVQALINRGLAAYTGHKEGRGGGKFPVEITVI